MTTSTLGDELAQHLDAVGRPRVERDAPLAAVPTPVQTGVVEAGHLGDETRRVAALRRFDLDDLGAQVGEVHRQLRRGEVGDLEDADVVEEANVGHPRTSTMSVPHPVRTQYLPSASCGDVSAVQNSSVRPRRRAPRRSSGARRRRTTTPPRGSPSARRRPGSARRTSRSSRRDRPRSRCGGPSTRR